MNKGRCRTQGVTVSDSFRCASLMFYVQKEDSVSNWFCNDASDLKEWLPASVCSVSEGSVFDKQ